MHETHFQIASLRMARSMRPKLHQPDHLVGQQVHVLGHGAAGRALAALVAVARRRFRQGGRSRRCRFGADMARSFSRRRHGGRFRGVADGGVTTPTNQSSAEPFRDEVLGQRLGDGRVEAKRTRPPSRWAARAASSPCRRPSPTSATYSALVSRARLPGSRPKSWANRTITPVATVGQAQEVHGCDLRLAGRAFQRESPLHQLVPEQLAQALVVPQEPGSPPPAAPACGSGW